MYLRLPIFTDEGEPTGQVLVVPPSAIQEGWIETAIVPLPPCQHCHWTDGHHSDCPYKPEDQKHFPVGQ